jgi:hypothetical protein
MASSLAPQDWFLPNVPFRDGNRVTPLVDGESYFAALRTFVETQGASPTEDSRRAVCGTACGRAPTAAERARWRWL